MRRVVVLVVALMVGLIGAAVPAAADPPQRYEGPFASVLPDFEHGVWVFSNTNRAFVCGGEDPLLGVALFQRVEPADAVVLRITAPDAPTSLHPFVGEVDEFFNPCDNSAQEAAYVGSVDIRANDDDGPNLGKRANTFGDRARGVVYDSDGMAYRFGWTARFVLHAIGG